MNAKLPDEERIGETRKKLEAIREDRSQAEEIAKKIDKNRKRIEQLDRIEMAHAILSLRLWAGTISDAASKFENKFTNNARTLVESLRVTDSNEVQRLETYGIILVPVGDHTCEIHLMDEGYDASTAGGVFTKIFPFLFEKTEKKNAFEERAEIGPQDVLRQYEVVSEPRITLSGELSGFIDENFLFKIKKGSLRLK